MDQNPCLRKFTIGYLPLMVKSQVSVFLYGKTPEELVKMGEDPLDPGGYFIVNGDRKSHRRTGGSCSQQDF